MKRLKDGHLLCEGLVQNCNDLSHIFTESRINRVLFRDRTVKTVHPYVCYFANGLKIKHYRVESVRNLSEYATGLNKIVWFASPSLA